VKKPARADQVISRDESPGPPDGSSSGTNAGGAASDAAPAKLTRPELIAISGALLALLLASIDQSVVGTALPQIVATLGGLDLYAWVGIAFMIAAVSVVPITGKLGDMFGRKPFLVAGIVGFVVSSALCGASHNMAELIGFRALQGLFGGVLLVTIFTVLVDVCPPAQRVRMQGVATAIFGIGSVVGPTLGGFITDTLGWRWVFFINVPLGAVSLLAVMTSVPRVRSSASWRDIDFLGVVTLVAGIVPLMVGVTLPGQGRAWNSPGVVALLAVGVLMLAIFVVVEVTRARHPVVPFRLFRIPQVAIMVALAFLSTFGMMGTVYFVPLLYQDVLGVTAAQSGNLLIPMMLALAVVSALSGRLLTKVRRYRFLASAAFVAIVVAMILLSWTGPATSRWLPAAVLVLVGAAMGVIYPMSTSVVQHAVPAESVGAGTSQVQFWRMMGGPLSLAALGAILAGQVAGSIRDRLATAHLPPGFRLPATLAGNAQTGLDNAQIARLRAGVPVHFIAAFDHAVYAIRLGLGDSLGTLFLSIAGVVAVAVILSLFLREVSLRPPAGAPQAASGGRPQAEKESAT
jgi:EmrB/QacA subfamily drug resistance transporter